MKQKEIREYCESHDTVAYWSGCGGVEIKGIEHGIDDYVICVVNAWYGEKEYKRYKISYFNRITGGRPDGRARFYPHGYEAFLDDCVRC